MRISIVGTSCSGKSTLARTLAATHGIPCIDLDDLNWRPGWLLQPREKFAADVATAVSGDTWVIAGNYGKVAQRLVWARATHVIWLDYPFPLVLWRALRRTVRRCMTQELVCNGNRESWQRSFASRDSILWWVITTWRKRRREIAEKLRDPEWSHLVVSRRRWPIH